MKLSINRRARIIAARRLTQLLAVCLLAANLIAPISLLLIGNAGAAGFDDDNSIVICTADGFKRITLDLDNPDQKTVDFEDCCDSFCPLCQLGQTVQFMPPQEELYVFPLVERAAPILTANNDIAWPKKHWRRVSVRAPPLSS